MFSLFFLRIENVRHLMFKNCYVLPHSVFLAFICVGLPKRQRCLVSPLQSGIMGGGVRGIIAAIAYMYTMLTPCTVLMHACAWIIIPLVRAEADDNSMGCTVRVAADRVLPTCKYEYLLI